MNQQTMTTTQAVQEIIESAQRSSDETRDCRGMSPGEAARQGDIYILRVMPGEVKHNGTPHPPQLAPGNSKGSRHVAEAVQGTTLQIFDRFKDSLSGPVIIADGDWRLLHPEHADFVFPAGEFVVRYQRNFEREELARVTD